MTDIRLLTPVCVARGYPVCTVVKRLHRPSLDDHDRALADMGIKNPRVSKQWLREYYERVAGYAATEETND